MEFKTPPPRAPKVRRPAGTPGLDDSILQPHLHENAISSNKSSSCPEVDLVQSPPLPDVGAEPSGLDVSFSRLSHAELKIRASEFGLRSTLSRQQIIDQLERIKAHQTAGIWSPRTTAAAELQQQGSQPSQSSVSGRAVPPTATSAVVLTTRASVSDAVLKSKITEAIRANEPLWSKMLQFQSVEVEDVKQALLKAKIKVSKEFIREYCVEKSVILAKVQKTKD